MDALIKVSSSEFNEDLFKKIKSLIQSFGNTEITIAVSNDFTLFKESRSDYWERIEESKKEIDAGGGIKFTMSEFEDYIHNLSAE